MLVHSEEIFNCEHSSYLGELGGTWSMLMEKSISVKKFTNESYGDINKVSPEIWFRYLSQRWIEKYRNQFKITILPKRYTLKIGNQIFIDRNNTNYFDQVITTDFKKIEINLLPNDYNIQVNDDIYISNLWEKFKEIFEEDVENIFKVHLPNVDTVDMKNYYLIFSEEVELTFITIVSYLALEHLSELLENNVVDGFMERLERVQDDFCNRIDSLKNQNKIKILNDLFNCKTESAKD